MNTVGETIKRKRKELNLTQAQLAEMIGSDEYYISAIETGKRKPGSKFLTALSNALNIPTDTLFGMKSNIVLSNKVTELESKLLLLNEQDREMLLEMFNSLADRLIK